MVSTRSTIHSVDEGLCGNTLLSDPLAGNIWYLFVAVLAGLGFVGKAPLFASFTHLSTRVAVILAALSPCLPFFASFVLRWSRVVGPLVLVLLLATFLFVFPKVEGLHKIGRGSDQADCVIVASHRMGQGVWPYVPAAMDSKNAMSCGPGWVAVQAPAIDLLNYSWNLICCWLVAVGVLFSHLGVRKTFGILSLIGLSAGTWLTAANGSDFLTFGILLLAFCVAVSPNMRGRGRLTKAVAAVALGLLAQFRIPTLLLPGFFSKRLGRTASISAFVVALAIQAAFLVRNVSSFVRDGPLHVGLKLMRTAVISGKPAVAALEFSVVGTVGFLIASLFSKRFALSQVLLFFMALVFFVPACQNFALRYRDKGGVINALQFWEGGMWITGMIPLAAACYIENVSANRPVSEDSPALLEPA